MCAVYTPVSGAAKVPKKVTLVDGSANHCAFWLFQIHCAEPSLNPEDVPQGETLDENVPRENT